MWYFQISLELLDVALLKKKLLKMFPSLALPVALESPD